VQQGPLGFKSHRYQSGEDHGRTKDFFDTDKAIQAISERRQSIKHMENGRASMQGREEDDGIRVCNPKAGLT